MKVWSGTKAEFEKRRYYTLDHYDLIALDDWPRSLLIKRRGAFDGTLRSDVGGDFEVLDLRGVAIVLEEDDLDIEEGPGAAMAALRYEKARGEHLAWRLEMAEDDGLVGCVAVESEA